ncbi:FCD domain-containing protein [Acuticoccus sp. MNP-M23]|uniref:FadR/GntR family transcriptional regulator n=1 Tax=Acuticoccus sp. MNP-M23 TaxID=3072793 RepID=UPI002814A2C0|nr:FCD domain-containing protein [Acuticoccus sp. MNP-M23]WMS41535.1 FCD domain-containing protein [Acuticoccus sp. MNP-M23]
MLKRMQQPVPIRTAERIQALIGESGLGVGDALPGQRQLAATLGVSRPSLREALSILETLGIIRVEAGRAAFVADGSGGGGSESPWRYGAFYSLRDVYQTRVVIEGMAAGLTALAVHGEVIAEFTAICDAMDDAAASRDPVALAGADARFHDLTLSLCGNALFQKIYRDTRDVFVESQRVPMVERARLAETAAEHRAVLDAFRARDMDGARAAMESHIRNAAARAGLSV